MHVNSRRERQRNRRVGSLTDSQILARGSKESGRTRDESSGSATWTRNKQVLSRGAAAALHHLSVPRHSRLEPRVEPRIMRLSFCS